MASFRGLAIAVIVVMLAGAGSDAPASAIPPPVIDPGALPQDSAPGPEHDMEQRQPCTESGIRPNSRPGDVSAAQSFMDLPALWRSAGQGAGVVVAVIDTGVSPSARLPHLRGGGDYVLAGGTGLQDCDGHGTIVASIIGGAPGKGDAFAGVAPAAELVSIRQTSNAYQAVDPALRTIEGGAAGTVTSMARAIVHAADSGADVINVSVAGCMSAADPGDQDMLGAALRYATVVKDAVVVAGAGNIGGVNCVQNPEATPADADDPRNWAGVTTISTPSWFADLVLSVSATDDTDRPAELLDGTPISLSGPWVDVAAPGNWVEGFNSRGELTNGTLMPDGQWVTLNGTSFAAAYTSGLAALIRAKFPELTAASVIDRIASTARNPAGFVDNRMGHGIINPVAALGAADAPIPTSTETPTPQAHRSDDHRSTAGLATAGVVAVLALGGGFIWALRRRKLR